MTAIGTVIDGKYEILKEIGRGGMSIVYLAMDKRLNKQWAVKEIRKKGNGKNDEIVVNSLLAEANLMKRLDHPALPRIVDIIDNGVTIYVVMDYIEGESLDKILAEYGAQPEEKVIEWAKQLCDALSYLHSQKKPIIYRDMKPANVMLKPEGNVKIIDFGIAREFKEQNLADTTVLGTKGYAPPEQYSGQTDPRSDIFALGMTMHHLLTGVDPRNGEPYSPVRQWNPELSEGIEAIIDKCVQPAAENRYQSCSELLYDLEHPELIGKAWKKKQKRKLFTFIMVFALAAVMAIVGLATQFTAKKLNNQDYDLLLSKQEISSYIEAISIFPKRIRAYEEMVDYLVARGTASTQADFNSAINALQLAVNKNQLDINDSDTAELCYKMGRVLFTTYVGQNGENTTTVERAGAANKFFGLAAQSKANFDKKQLASDYYKICALITGEETNNPSVTVDAEKYQSALNTLRNGLVSVGNIKDDRYASYDKAAYYYMAFMFIQSCHDQMISTGIRSDELISVLETVKTKMMGLNTRLAFIDTVKNKYFVESTNGKTQYDMLIEIINTEYYQYSNGGGN